MSISGKTTVFYDGACPLCQREIAFYRRRRGADNIIWIDVSRSEDDAIAPGLTRDQALARFHVINAEGKPVSGGEAFACLWASLPGFRRLGNFLQTQPLLWVLNNAYDLFLYLRPLLQRIARSPKVTSCPKVPGRSLRDQHPPCADKPDSDGGNPRQRD